MKLLTRLFLLLSPLVGLGALFLVLLATQRCGADFATAHGWEYRYESHRGLQPPEAGWKAARAPINPGTWNGDDELWLRLRIPDDIRAARNPVVLVPIIDQAVQAFLDGKEIYNFGNLRPNGSFVMRGYPPHFIALPPESEGRTLLFRVASRHNSIGLSGEIRFGDRAALVEALVLTDLPKVALSSIILALGLFVLTLFLQNRTARALLAYGMLLTGMGVYTGSACETVRLVTSHEVTRFWIEILSLFFTSVGVVEYIDHVFFQPRSIRWFRLFYIRPLYVFLVAAPVFALTGAIPLLQTLLPWQIFVIVGMPLGLWLPVRLALKHDAEAIAVTAAVTIFLACSALSILAANNLFPRDLSKPLAIVGAVALIAGMGSIILRRYRSLNEKIRAYNQELREKNEQLSRIDKLKDQFLANTSHELRTPLVGILGIVESVLDGASGPVPDQLRKNLRLVVQSGRRLSALINDILDFSKLRERRIEVRRVPVNLAKSVEFVVALSQVLVQRKNVTLQNAVPPDLPAVLADPDRLEQTLSNLIGNAIKFTKEGHVTVSARETDGEVVVCVSDTGIGIPKEKWEVIFHEFEQGDASTSREFGGTGLGLAVTRQLISLMGGRLWLESEVGKGSRFHFSLPVTDEVPGESEDTINTAIRHVTDVPLVEVSDDRVDLPVHFHPHGEGLILVVDDEPVNRQVLENLLTNRGYDVISAHNGPDALAMVASGRLPDVILLDVMMPGLTGYQVCTELRKQHGKDELPIIFLTAKNQLSNLVEGFSVGGNDYLTKPFHANELLARVSTQRDLARATREMAEASARLDGVLQCTREMALSAHRVAAVRLTAETILNRLGQCAACTVDFALSLQNPAGGTSMRWQHSQCCPGENGQWSWEERATTAARKRPALEADTARTGSQCILSPGAITVEAVHGGRLKAVLHISGIACERLLPLDVRMFRILAESVAIILAGFDLADQRDIERHNRREEEKRSLVRIVSIAARISDKLNSPLLTLLNSLERNERQVQRFIEFYDRVAPDEALRAREHWTQTSAMLKSAVAGLSQLSKQLEELREEGQRIEATEAMRRAE